MKNKKILITALLVVTLAVVLTAVACEKTKTDNLDLVLGYASECTSLKVEVCKDGATVYVYDNGEVTDEYGLNIDVSSIVGKAGEKGLALKKSDLKEGYSFSVEDNKATLTAQLADAEKLLGVNATVNVSVKADLSAKSVTEYKVGYTDKNGYDVVITLSK